MTSLQVAGHSVFTKECIPAIPEQEDALPVLILHGGPGVPSDYLQPIGPRLAARAAPHAPRRVAFYDQLGCGRSAAPSADQYPYGIASSVAQAAAVLAELRSRSPAWGRGFHLLGQSWGGILAIEYALASAQSADLPAPASLVVANAPADVAALHAEVARLADGLPEPLRGAMADAASPGHAAALVAFYSLHRCRTSPEPPCIAAAYAHAGAPPWRGTGAIAEWSAASALQAAAGAGGGWPGGLRTLLVSGEHDFVTPPCVASLQALLPACRWEMLMGSSHMPHLEAPSEFDAVLRAFLAEEDRAAAAARRV